MGAIKRSRRRVEATANRCQPGFTSPTCVVGAVGEASALVADEAVVLVITLTSAELYNFVESAVKGMRMRAD